MASPRILPSNSTSDTEEEELLVIDAGQPLPCEDAEQAP